MPLETVTSYKMVYTQLLDNTKNNKMVPEVERSRR